MMRLGKCLLTLRLSAKMRFLRGRKKVLYKSGEYKRGPKSEKARGSSVATTRRRRCVKIKGVVGMVPGWEIGRGFGFKSKLVCFGKLGKKSIETRKRCEVSKDGGSFYSV